MVMYYRLVQRSRIAVRQVPSFDLNKLPYFSKQNSLRQFTRIYQFASVTGSCIPSGLHGRREAQTGASGELEREWRERRRELGRAGRGERDF